MWRTWKKKIEEALLSYLPQPPDCPEKLYEAMVYSLSAGGKRIRPLLLLASAYLEEPDISPFIPSACALEYIHTYSLIHDDLPAMDNDSLRRGKPTAHRVFGEGLAILAGDTLLTEAFRLLSQEPSGLPAEKRLHALTLVAQAAGAKGMAGGQVLDLLYQGKNGDAQILKKIHTMKTGALIQVALVLGGVYTQADSSLLEKRHRLGEALGLLFQITDDYLDETSSREALGKSPGKDKNQDKLTYPKVYGLMGTLKEAKKVYQEIQGLLQTFLQRKEPLQALVDRVYQRVL